jgi:NADH dehydrogenase
MAEVHKVDFERKLILTDGEPVSYDYLILAAGSANNYFGNNSLAHSTFGLKDIADAEQLRDHILSCFEKAVRERDDRYRSMLMTFVVVGGGPTGVELAGALVELFRHVLRRDYPELNTYEAQVVLVEGMDSLLLAFPPKLREKARQELEQRGVEVRLNTLVTDVKGNQVSFKDGSHIEAGTVVWSAGVRASELADVLGVTQGKSARVRVTPILNLPGSHNVFVIGDMAYLEGYKKSNQPHPMVAQVAIQQGKRAAKNILAHIHKEPMKAFRYADKGNMATIGRSNAVLDAFGIRLSGYLAWLGWLFVHLMTLVGFRNRLIVFVNWAYSYFTYDRGVRIITSHEIREQINGHDQHEPYEQHEGERVNTRRSTAQHRAGAA